jgi:hypothetical protein
VSGSVLRGDEDERRDVPGRAIWVAWGLALFGGVAVLVAAYLLVRVDLTGPCTPGTACAVARSPITAVLAFGGTGLAVIGGGTATALAVTRSR